MSQWEKVGNIMGPQGPPGTGGGAQVYGEIPTASGGAGAYLTSQPFQSGSLRVFLNGLRQSVTTDYTITGTNSFHMNTPPLTGDHIMVDYAL